MPDDLNKPRVLVSYSPQPRENARFAGGLAEGLRRVGFEVSLYEVQKGTEPVAEVVTGERTKGTRHSLVIVTNDWLDAPGSQAELELPAGRPVELQRRVAVLRERVDKRLLAARLPGTQSIDWLPEDQEPDARFWEVYCALTRTTVGDPCDWARNGRNLLGGWKPAEAASGAGETADVTAFVECPSRPVLAQPADGWTLLLTDTGKCFQVDREEPPRLHPLPDLDGCSAVTVDAMGRLFVGFFEGMVATPRDGEWAYHAADAPVLSLVATDRGVAIGDAHGFITFRDDRSSAHAKVAAGEPVVEMIALNSEVVALGARGGLWRVGWTESGSISLLSVSPNEALGRPVGLFYTGDALKVGVFSAERVALLGLESRFLTVGIRRFPEGINSVARFGPKPGAADHPPFCVLTDSGQVWIASADLKTVAPVVLPDESKEVVGLAPGPAGWVLAWSAAGTLVAVGRDRGVRTLATSRVTLAYAEPDRTDQIAAISWQPENGVQASRLGLEPAR